MVTQRDTIWVLKTTKISKNHYPVLQVGSRVPPLVPNLHNCSPKLIFDHFLHLISDFFSVILLSCFLCLFPHTMATTPRGNNVSWCCDCFPLLANLVPPYPGATPLGEQSLSWFCNCFPIFLVSWRTLETLLLPRILISLLAITSIILVVHQSTTWHCSSQLVNICWFSMIV